MSAVRARGGGRRVKSESNWKKYYGSLMNLMKKSRPLKRRSNAFFKDNIHAKRKRGGRVKL